MTGRRQLPVRDLRSIDRLVFFSDAVFAIAMTLLVLTLKIPEPGQDVEEAILDNATRFFAFALSFWVIAMFWFLHFRLFRLEPKWDDRLAGLDLGLLFAIAFLPYPTAVVGNAPSDDVAATVLYACSITITALLSLALANYILTVSLRGRMDPAAASRIVWVSAMTPLAFAITIPIAFVNPIAAQWLWVVPLVVKIPWVDRRLAAHIPHHLDDEAVFEEALDEAAEESAGGA